MILSMGRCQILEKMSFLVAAICPAATIYVPDDFPDIKDAIAAAADNDTIVVRPGIYRGKENRGFRSAAAGSFQPLDVAKTLL